MKRFHNNIMVCRWNDTSKVKSTKIVSMLSTIHIGAMVETEKKNRITGHAIKNPDVIADYNKTMGGVDTLSRVLIPYSSQRRGRKWYRKLSELFMDIAVYNSFVCWKKLNPPNNFTHLAFRKQLIREIITCHAYGMGTQSTGVNVGSPLRLIERHFIEKCPGKSNSRCQRRCIVCNQRGKRRDTRYWCPDCQVGLCLEDCFKIYHTIRDYSQTTKSSSSSSEEDN